MEAQQSVSKLSTESVGSRRELVANSCIHTADADAMQLDSWVASSSAVCIGYYLSPVSEAYSRRVQSELVIWRRIHRRAHTSRR